MKTRNTDRTYDWNGHKGLPISFSHLTDEQMAGTVRMLMRHDLGHEGIVCGARDRIMCLAKEKAVLEARIAELEAAAIPSAKTNLVGPPKWRVFEDMTHGWWGIEEDIHDGNTILYPKKMNREPLDGIVRAHNAALATTEGQP